MNHHDHHEQEIDDLADQVRLAMVSLALHCERVNNFHFLDRDVVNAAAQWSTDADNLQLIVTTMFKILEEKF